MAADHLIQLPAWLSPVLICKACTFPFIRAIGNLPAGSVMQEFFDPFDTDFFIMDEIPDTKKPFDVIL